MSRARKKTRNESSSVGMPAISLLDANSSLTFLTCALFVEIL
jgi:hypothetical protein